jgi:hypothetical protein
MSNIVLQSGATTILLPEDIPWVDEYTDWRAAQTLDYSLTGALIIHESARLAGRPITLQSGANWGWVRRSVAEALRTLSDSVGSATMTLTMPTHPSGTRNFTVRFRRTDGGAVEAAPIRFKAPPADTDYYSLIVRMMEVPA